MFAVVYCFTILNTRRRLLETRVGAQRNKFGISQKFPYRAAGYRDAHIGHVRLECSETRQTTRYGLVNCGSTGAKR